MDWIGIDCDGVSVAADDWHVGIGDLEGVLASSFRLAV